MTANAPFFVLVGGDSMEHQGPDVERRDFLHTSLTHIGHAYEKLRHVGITREQIIVIVQLKDFLRSPHIVPGNYAHKSVMSACSMLLAEGGADYDFDLVNPGTVWSVLSSSYSSTYTKVVPMEASTVFFAIYSHGDVHPARRDLPRSAPFNHLTHEWFAHMPYPTQSEDLSASMLSFISTDGASGDCFHTPERYLYSTQLRYLFIKMFSSRPHRPVVGLLNFCLSGSCQEFMKRPACKDYYGSDKWPLFLMSASQAHQDALIGGLWTAFFHQLANHLQPPPAEVVPVAATPMMSGPVHTEDVLSGNSALRLMEFFHLIRASYFQHNVYELYGHVATRAYATTGSGYLYGRYPIELKPLLCSGEGGDPDYVGLQRLQQEWRRPKGRSKYGIRVWLTDRWEQEEADLAEVVREARYKIALPDVVYGEKSSIACMTLNELFYSTPMIRCLRTSIG